MLTSSIRFAFPRPLCTPQLWRALGIITTGLVLGCSEPLTPTRNSPLPNSAAVERSTVPDDSDLLGEESFASHTQTITVNADGSVTGNGPFPSDWYSATVYQGSITGSVTSTSTKTGASTTYGPCDNWRAIPTVRWSTLSTYNVGEWTACETGTYKDYFITRSSHTWGEFVISPYHIGNCSGYSSWYFPCATLSGSYTLELTRLNADLELSPSRQTIESGEIATFEWVATPDSLGGHATPVTVRRTFFQPDSAAMGGVEADSIRTCTVSGSSCTIQPQGSGTLHIWAMVNGQLVHKTAYVNVVPCPTGDDVLDQPNIRSDFMEMMTLSNPDSAPGTGMDSQHLSGAKREHALWLYQRPDGSYFSIPVDASDADECHIDFGHPPTDTLGGHVLAIAHTHPADSGTVVFGNCQAVDKNGRVVQIKRYPGDPEGRLGRAGDDSKNGGGSDLDWRATKVGYNVYTMNQHGEVWLLPAYTDDENRMDNRNDRVHKWVGNSNLSCNW